MFLITRDARKKTKKKTSYTMINKLKLFLTEDQGQDMVEYSLLLILIGTVVLIYLTGMGMNLGALLQHIEDKLEYVSNSFK